MREYPRPRRGSLATMREPKITPASVLAHDGVLLVSRKTLDRCPTFDVVGRFEVAVLAEEVLDLFAASDAVDDVGAPTVAKLNITVGGYTISALRSDYAEVAIITVAGHKIGKSVSRMLRSLVTPPKGGAAPAEVEPPGLAVVP